jgi:hypothetical protein
MKSVVWVAVLGYLSASTCWAQAENKIETPSSPASVASASPSAPASPATVPTGTPYLGIQTEELPDGMVSQLSGLLAPGEGVLVSDVIASSPASQCGVQKFDILRSIDGKSVHHPRDVFQMVYQKTVGSSVNLGLLRGGRATTLTVTLGHRERELGSDPSLKPRSSSWTSIESLRLDRIADDKFSLGFRYRGAQNEQIDRSFVGSRAQIRQQVRSDTVIPEICKDFLLDHLEISALGPRGQQRTWLRGLSTELRRLMDQIEMY